MHQLTTLSSTLVILLASASASAQEPSVHASQEPTGSGQRLRHSLDTSPISPFLGIWVLQDAYEFSPNNEVMLGASYMNIPFDSGDTHAISVFLGYRRYFWRNLHAEIQAWPMVDDFYEKHEKRYYKSFDLWAEARVGYRFDFDVSNLHCYVNVQFLLGKGLYVSNKPQSFHDEGDRSSKLLGFFDFYWPMAFTGIRF